MCLCLDWLNIYCSIIISIPICTFAMPTKIDAHLREKEYFIDIV